MDSEKQALPVAGFEQSEKTTTTFVDERLTSEPIALQPLNGPLYKQETSAGTVIHMPLTPLKTQVLYWAGAAGIVAFRQTALHTISLEPLTAPILAAMVILCLLATTYYHRRGRPWWDTPASWIFGAGLHTLVFVEMLMTMLLFITSLHSSPKKPLTLRQELVFRFLLNSLTISMLDREKHPRSRVTIPNVGPGASLWCNPTWLLIKIDGQWMWKRGDNKRAMRHLGLTYAVMFPFMTGIAWCLDVTPIPIVSLGLWGAGCLAEGFDHGLLQVLALRPLHDLVFCLCHHILLGVASIEERRRNEWL